jgi:hypothetical protein
MSAALGDPAPIVRGVSLKRFGLPGDIAEVVAFLASDASGWITGHVLTANGGQVASVAVLKSLSWRLAEFFEVLEEFTPVLRPVALPHLEELTTLSLGVSCLLGRYVGA